MAGFKSIFRTQLTDVATTDWEGVGRLRWEDDKCYRWVQNAITNVDMAANGLVCHLFTDGANSLKKINKPATAVLGYLGGVAMTTIYSNTGTGALCYGWIQVYGLSASVAVTPANTQTTAAPVSGNALVGVNTAFWAATGTADGTAPAYQRNIKLLDSVAGSTTVQTCTCEIHCL